MKIRFILAGEGSSDLRLAEHIENILISEGFSEVTGESPNLGLLAKKVGHSVKDKLHAITHYYPSADLIFVHRDADNVGVQHRISEITDAASELFIQDKTIPIIPVTMLETWLLADRAAIMRVAGAGNSKAGLTCLPAANKLESIRDSKTLLLEALCEASKTSGARREKFKKRFTEMRARLTYDLDPNGPVNDLDSYKSFRRSISAVAEQLLNHG